MTTGKNKLLRFARLYFGGYDLSGDTRTFDTLENSMKAVDLTGLSDEVENVIADLRRVLGVKGYKALLNDAAAGVHTILKDAPKSHVLSVFLGGGDAPAVGDMAYLLPALQMGDQSDFSEGIGALTADFMLDASQMSSLVDKPFGVVLLPKTDLTGTTTGTAVDNGAATTGGARANLHIFVSSGGTWEFKVQHSSDNSSWADLMTFTITGNSVTSEMKTASGTINRYTRILATRTSGTCTVACALARN